MGCDRPNVDKGIDKGKGWNDRMGHALPLGRELGSACQAGVQVRGALKIVT